MNERLISWTSLALCIVAAAISFAAFDALPAEVPTHWNAAGVVDGWSTPLRAASILPLAMALTWLMFWGLPRISPSGWRIEPFQGVWGRVQLGMLGFLLLVHFGLMGSAVGWIEGGIPRLVFAGTGLLFLLFGNYLGKTTRNFFFGIRTPWTLASDEVWRRTHRLGGWLMVGAGLVLIGMAVFGASTAMLVGTVLVVALVPFVYSYFVYRQVEGFRPPPPE